MSTPLVTVGVPVHNGARFLERTLDSVLAQGIDDLEVIISDNGSTDATAAICRRYARQPRIRYLRSPRNRGAAWNYNRLVALARGPYFKWASADDVLAPTYLERCLETFERGGRDVVLCYPRTMLIDADDRVVEHYEDRMDLPLDDPVARLRVVLRDLRLCNAVFGLVRRDVLRGTRLIGPYHSSDAVLLAELVLRGEVHEIPERLFRRRRLDEPGARHRLSLAELNRWFEPTRRARHFFPRTRLISEHVRAIAKAPLSPSQRLRCLGVLASEWGPRYWRVVGGEFKRALLPTAIS